VRTDCPRLLAQDQHPKTPIATAISAAPSIVRFQSPCRRSVTNWFLDEHNGDFVGYVEVSATEISIISPFGEKSVYDFVPDFGVGGSDVDQIQGESDRRILG